MLKSHNKIQLRKLQSPLITIISMVIALGFGLAVQYDPLILVALAFAVIGCYCLIRNFETTIMGLLIIRSSLDAFSSQGLPALFGAGLILLMIFYISWALLTEKEIQTDGFFWFLLSWVAIQSVWVILLPLGGLGAGAGATVNALEGWIRLFALVMAYLLVLQLRGKIHPAKFVNLLFLSLVIPLSAALLQVMLPQSSLPDFLTMRSIHSDIEGASRLNGTLGHPNSLASFLVLFTGLSYWKSEVSRNRLPWYLLLGVLLYFIIGTKAMGGLAMTVILFISISLSKANPARIIGGAILAASLVLVFASSEFGRQRLSTLSQNPFLNPEIDISRVFIMIRYTVDSFYWRIVQWYSIIEAWKENPILGYGLSTTRSFAVFDNSAHNDYVRALAETGIVGFILFVGLLLVNLGRFLYVGLSSPANSPQRILCFTLFGFFLALCVGMLTDNVLSQTTLFIYVFALSSIVTWKWDGS